MMEKEGVGLGVKIEFPSPRVPSRADDDGAASKQNATVNKHI